MTKLYDGHGFYDTAFHAPHEIPDGAIEVSDEDWLRLQESQLQMQSIQPDKHGNPVAVAPPAPSLDDLRAAKLAEINAKASALLALTYVDVPPDEVSTWGKQETEARALKADPKAAPKTAAPFISVLAATRGVPLNLLVEKIIEKADACAQYTAQVVGTRQHLEDVLSAIDLTDADAAQKIEAIKWPA